jgi:hypothetical protein
MLFELHAFAQNDDVTSFLQVFLAVALVVAVIYAGRALLRPANPVRSVTMPVARKSPPVRSRQATNQAEPQQPVATPSDPEPERIVLKMPGEAHWQRAIAPMQSSITRGHRARELHQRASIRLSAADYAFDRMLEELSAVIVLPVRATASGTFNAPALVMNAGPTSLAA